MNTLVLHRRRGPLGRAIYSAHVATPEHLLSVLPPTKVAGQHFVLFLAWDTRATSDEAILAFARELVRLGLSYVVAWGPDCERVHDVFDEADILENPEHNEPGGEAVVMSTWHEGEPLEKALWFAAHAAYPAAPYDATTISTVAAVVANSNWANSVEAYLADLARK